MSPPFFFGYGSLVNRATHTYPMAQPARLDGYRRVWRATVQRKLAYLSVEPAQDVAIEGLIAAVPESDWEALDRREAAYTRQVVTPQVIANPRPAEVWVYAVEHPLPETEKQDYPILRSYLDVVLQGFLREFGQSGPEQFMATTRGWQHPILDDRDAPIYPRAQTISADETAYFDQLIAAL